MTTIAAALLVGSLTPVAVTLKVPTACPAVNKPVESIVDPGAVVDPVTELFARICEERLRCPLATEAQVTAAITKVPPARSGFWMKCSPRRHAGRMG